MDVKGLEAFGDDLRLVEALAATTPVLESVLGRSASTTTAEWSRGVDLLGRPTILLSLSDWTGSRSAAFTRDELFQSYHMEGRLIRFWGDFLEQSSHKLLEPILKSLQDHPAS